MRYVEQVAGGLADGDQHAVPVPRRARPRPAATRAGVTPQRSGSVSTRNRTPGAQRGGAQQQLGTPGRGRRPRCAGRVRGRAPRPARRGGGRAAPPSRAPRPGSCRSGRRSSGSLTPGTSTRATAAWRVRSRTEPSSDTAPESGRSRPARTRARAVWPWPGSPTTARTSPVWSSTSVGGSIARGRPATVTADALSTCWVMARRYAAVGGRR